MMRGLGAIAAAGLLACLSRTSTREEVPARPALGAPIERVGRALTANALLGPLAPDEVSDRRKEEYNRAAPAEWSRFAGDIALEIGLYDGYDGTCGNQWLADRGAGDAERYRRLSTVLADDRLWIDSRSRVCQKYLAVELAALGAPGAPAGDCGGRTPDVDAIDVFRSLLVAGSPSGVSDGVDGDDRVHSIADFPFLAAP